jgi:uncharacterized protein (DUF488 family)
VAGAAGLRNVGRVELITLGHGRLDRDGLGSLLVGAGVDLLVDVRRYPGSRANPDVKREALEAWLPERGPGYRWDGRLGGRRRLDGDSPDPWWQVGQFRGYAAHTRTPEFAEAMSELLDEARGRTVAVMCSESVWWRCHRRLIADVAVLRYDVRVEHLMHDGRLREHAVASGARVGEDGCVYWDGPR